MKGQKTGGREKGTPNKRTAELQERIKDACGEDFDPVLAMAKLAQEELVRLGEGVVAGQLLKAIAEGDKKALDHALKAMAASKSFALEALAEVSQYVHAKRKAVEVQGEGNLFGALVDAMREAARGGASG